MILSAVLMPHGGNGLRLFQLLWGPLWPGGAHELRFFVSPTAVLGPDGSNGLRYVYPLLVHWAWCRVPAGWR